MPVAKMIGNNHFDGIIIIIIIIIIIMVMVIQYNKNLGEHEF